MTLRDTNPVNDPAGVTGNEVARLWLDPEADWSGTGTGQGPHTGTPAEIGSGGTWPNRRGRTNPTPPKWVIDDAHPGAIPDLPVGWPLRTFNVGSSSDTGAVNGAALAARLASGTLLAGDLIRLAAGATFTGDFTVGATGTAAQPIVIEQGGTNAEWWRTGGGNPAIITGGGFQATARSHIQFRHLYLLDLTTSGKSKRGFYIIGSSGGTSNVVIYGCKVRNALNSGVGLWGASFTSGIPDGNYDRLLDVIVESNLIELSQYETNETITVSNGVNRVDIRYNILRHGVPGGNEGIDFKNGVNNGKIHGNIIYDLRLRALYIDGGENTDHDQTTPSLVQNCEIFDNYVLGSYHAGTALSIFSEGVGGVSNIKIYNNIFREMGYTSNGTAYSGIHITDHFEEGLITDPAHPNWSVVEFVNAGTVGEGLGAVTPGMPASLVAGDLLLCHIEGEGEDVNADLMSAPGSWTLVGSSVASATDGAATRTRHTVYRAWYSSGINRQVADAGDHTLAVITAWRGVDPTTPIDVTPTTTTDSIGDTTANAVSVTSSGTMGRYAMIVYSMSAGAAVTYSSPSYPGALTVTGTAATASTGSGSTGSIGVFKGMGTSSLGAASGSFSATTSAAAETAAITIALRRDRPLQPPAFNGIEIRNNTIIDVERYGIEIARNVSGFNDTIIEGNLVYGSDGSYDIYDVRDTASTLNLAKDDPKPIVWAENPPANLTLPASVTSQNLLYEPAVGSSAVNPTPALPVVPWLTRDFHGRQRSVLDYGAVEYFATEPAT